MVLRNPVRQVTLLVAAVCFVARSAWATAFAVPVEVEVWLAPAVSAGSDLPARIVNWHGTSQVRVEAASPSAERAFGFGLRDNVLRIWVGSFPGGVTKVLFAFRESGKTRYLERRLLLGVPWGELEVEQLAEVIRGSGEALAEGLVGTPITGESELTEVARAVAATSSGAVPSEATVKHPEPVPPKAATGPTAPRPFMPQPEPVPRIPLQPYATLGPRLHHGTLAGWTGGLELGAGMARRRAASSCDLGISAGLELPSERRTAAATLTVVQSDLRTLALCGPRLGAWGLLGGVAIAATYRSLTVTEWSGDLPAVAKSDRIWRGAVLVGSRLQYQSGPVELGLSTWLQRNARDVAFVSNDGGTTNVLASTGAWESYVHLDARLLLWNAFDIP